MREIAVKFDSVTKIYESHAHKSAGLKNYLLNIFRKKFDENDHAVVLDKLSFELYKGETVGFVGRNGAGKSTLLSIIAQVIRPNAGRVYVSGRVSSLLELGAGFHPDLTGRENIELYGVVLGFSREEVRRKFEDIIEFSELGDHVDVPIRYYSSGMLARLGFSVIAHLDPQILLVDEVLAVGDYRFQNKCKKTMEKFKSEKRTIILVSHSAADIEGLCDRAIWIENSVVKMDGKPDVVMQAYQNT